MQEPIVQAVEDQFSVVDHLEPAWTESSPERRWLAYDYDDLLKPDKLSLDLFWIRDKSLTDTDALPAPVIAAETAADLEAALEKFTKIAARLRELS